MAVVASATGAAVFGLSGVAAGVAGGALLGAGAGALYSGITGDGNVLNSALTGGLIGGGVGGLGAAFGPGLMGGELAAGGAGLTGGGAFMPAAGSGASFAVPTAASAAAAAPTPAVASSILNAGNAVLPGELGDIAVNSSGQLLGSNGAVLNPTIAQGAAEVTPWQAEVARTQAETLTPANVISKTPSTGLTSNEMLGYGLAGTAALSLLGGMNQKKLTAGQYPGQSPSQIRPYTYNVSQNQSAYPTGPQYGASGLPILPTSEQKYFNQSYTAGTPYNAASGGLMSAPPVPGMMQSGPANVNFMGNDMYPTSQQHRSYYATPTQMPTGAQAAMASYEPNTNPLTGELMQSMAQGGQVNLQGTFTEGGGSGQPQGANGYAPAGGSPWGGGQFSSPYNTFPAPQGLGGLGGVIGAGIDPRSINRTGVSPTGYGSGLTAAQHGVIDMGRPSPVAMTDSIQFAAGGVAGGQYNLGSYSDGGRLLKGPGDGVSDDIPAVIGDKQPARLADGEFVIPARIVSELGNGSTDAGAKRLYAMMDNIQAGRKKTIGKNNVAKDTKAKKHLLA